MFKLSKIKSNTLMFHNFHDNQNFLKTPGSLSKIKFEKLIRELKKKFNILSPDNFFESKKKELKKKIYCSLSTMA